MAKLTDEMRALVEAQQCFVATVVKVKVDAIYNLGLGGARVG